jgi:hypothetical protein
MNNLTMLTLIGRGSDGHAVATTLAFGPDGATLAEGENDGSMPPEGETVQ